MITSSNAGANMVGDAASVDVKLNTSYHDMSPQYLGVSGVQEDVTHYNQQTKQLKNADMKYLLWQAS